MCVGIVTGNVLQWALIKNKLFFSPSQRVHKDLMEGGEIRVSSDMNWLATSSVDDMRGWPNGGAIMKWSGDFWLLQCANIVHLNCQRKHLRVPWLFYLQFFAVMFEIHLLVKYQSIPTFPEANHAHSIDRRFGFVLEAERGSRDLVRPLRSSFGHFGPCQMNRWTVWRRNRTECVSKTSAPPFNCRSQYAHDSP